MGEATRSLLDATHQGFGDDGRETSSLHANNPNVPSHRSPHRDLETGEMWCKSFLFDFALEKSTGLPLPSRRQIYYVYPWKLRINMIASSKSPLENELANHTPPITS